MLLQIAYAIGLLATGFLGGIAVMRWRLGRRRATERAAESDSSLRYLHDIACRVNVHVSEHAKYVEDVQRELAEFNVEGQSDGQAVAVAAEALRLANERMRTELVRARHELEEQAEELESHRREARTDGLTRLLNRRAFDEEMQQLPARLLRSVTDATLLLIDIDHFKNFNDRYGHQLGDAVLTQVGNILRQTLLGLDVVTARYGGEEFAVICTNSSLPVAARLAEEVRLAVEKLAIEHEGEMLSITISIGLGHSENGMYPYDTLARADEALYAAKNAGRNRTFFHNGAECFPVIKLLGRLESPPVAAPAPSEAPLSHSSRERRQQARGRDRSHHLIAPLVNGRLPAPPMHFRAWFFDISSGGFGMLLPSPPAAKYFAVALDEAAESQWVTAEVVRLCRSSEHDDTGRSYWEVGCRILGKLPSHQPELAEALLV